MVVLLSNTLLLLVILVTSTASGVANNPRIFRISATSLYDAGFQHGTLAKDLIQSAFQLPEFQAMRAFVSKSNFGKTTFDRLIKDNTTWHLPKPPQIEILLLPLFFDLFLLFLPFMVGKLKSELLLCLLWCILFVGKV